MSQIQEIRLYMLLRLFMLFSILFSIVLYQQSGLLDEGVILKIYSITFLTFWITSILIFLYEYAKKTRYLIIGQITYDLIFTTVLVLYTGPYESIYTVFYLFNIIFAGILFSVKGGVLASFASGTLYAMVTWFHARSFSHESFFSLLTTLMAFIAIALLAGQFIEELKKSRKRISQEVEEKIKLQERLADISRLSGGIAHAILNPIASISGAAQLLSDESSDKHEKTNLIQIIIRESERVDRLLTQLLQFAKPIVVKKHSFFLDQVITDCVSAIKTRPDFKNLVVKISTQVSQPLKTHGSSDQLSEAITNLLVNSMQAFIAQKKNLEKWITVSGSYQKDQIEVTIEDNGPGIHPQLKNHIFDPFFTTKPAGIGLGLAQVYKIIREHDGNITVKTKVGRGTKFILTLPS